MLYSHNTLVMGYLAPGNFLGNMLQLMRFSIYLEGILNKNNGYFQRRPQDLEGGGGKNFFSDLGGGKAPLPPPPTQYANDFHIEIMISATHMVGEKMCNLVRPGVYLDQILSYIVFCKWSCCVGQYHNLLCCCTFQNMFSMSKHET